VTTLKDLLNETLTNLHGYTADLEQVTGLSSAIGTSDITLPVDDASQITQGLIEIDSELMWVKSVDRNSNQLTIASFGRGFRETSAAAHSQNAMIVNNPRFPRASALLAIQQTLSSVYPGVFQVAADESNTVNPVRISYSVPAACDIIIDVRWQTVGPS